MTSCLVPLALIGLSRGRRGKGFGQMRAASLLKAVLLLMVSSTIAMPDAGFATRWWASASASGTAREMATTFAGESRPAVVDALLQRPAEEAAQRGSRVGGLRAGIEDPVAMESSLNAVSGGSTLLGLGIAALSALFNGSFPVCARIPRVEPDPVLFNGIVCFGVFLSSLLVPLGTGGGFQFTLAGALGGALFVFAALCSFLAIPRAGLATAQAVWSCSAILVAFGWGAFGPKEVAEPVKDMMFSVGAILLMVIGALIIVTCSSLAARFFGSVPTAPTESALPTGEEQSPEASIASTTKDDDAAQRISGLALAASVGLFGGSVLVPFKFVPEELAGLGSIPSFGIGALVTGVLVTAAYWFASVRGSTSSPATQVGIDTILAGTLSGFIWNAGNVCSIIAQAPPYSLSYGIAYPILQSALFFGGLWGIFIFGEIKGSAVGIFWAGATTLIGGIVLLSYFGPGAA